jgi:hypothetical protein
MDETLPQCIGATGVQHACCSIGATDSILIIKPCWLDLILSGMKTLEVRAMGCSSKVGKRIWLCASGQSMVVGSAVVVASIGPLSCSEWYAMRRFHCVPGPRFYGDRTFGWWLRDVKRVMPVPITRKSGSVIWQTGPGP